jgi:hypothetical protein
MRRPVPGKATVHIYISPEILEKTKRWVYWNPGATGSALIQELLENHIKSYEKKHGELEEPDDITYKRIQIR